MAILIKKLMAQWVQSVKF